MVLSRRVTAHSIPLTDRMGQEETVKGDPLVF